MERLQKVIANSGITSRRQAEVLISEGKVSVNDHVITELGTTVDPAKDRILVQGKTLPKPPHVVYALYKPVGVVCSRVAQGKEKTVTQLLPKMPVVYPIGRLDKESEGLILLTNDGALTERLTHPRHEHSKIYYVLATWQTGVTPLTPEQIIHKLKKGRKLGDGLAKADSVTILPSQDPQKIRLEITVHEGRNHLIRRLCATLGLDIILLKRTQFATLKIGNLRAGQFRRLTELEIARL